MKKLKIVAEGLGLALAALAVASLCTRIAADDSGKAFHTPARLMPSSRLIASPDK